MARISRRDNTVLSSESPLLKSATVRPVLPWSQELGLRDPRKKNHAIASHKAGEVRDGTAGSNLNRARIAMTQMERAKTGEMIHPAFDWLLARPRSWWLYEPSDKVSAPTNRLGYESAQRRATPGLKSG